MMTATMSMIEAMYQPMIVIGCAMVKGRRWAILRRRERFAIIAMAKEAALIAMSLG